MDTFTFEDFIPIEIVREQGEIIYEGIIVGAKECRRLNTRRKALGIIDDKVVNKGLERLITGRISFEYRKPDQEQHRTESLKTYTSRSGQITLSEKPSTEE